MRKHTLNTVECYMFCLSFEYVHCATGTSVRSRKPQKLFIMSSLPNLGEATPRKVNASKIMNYPGLMM